MRAVGFNVSARANAMIMCAIGAMNHVVRLLTLLVIPILLRLTNMPALHVICNEHRVRMLRRDGHNACQGFVLRAILPVTCRILLRRRVILHLSAILRATDVTGKGLLVPLFVSRYVFTLRERGNARKGNRIQWDRHSEKITRNLNGVA